MRIPSTGKGAMLEIIWYYISMIKPFDSVIAPILLQGQNRSGETCGPRDFGPSRTYNIKQLWAS